MRKVSLINGRNETLDVTTTELFLSELEGLGFEKSETFKRAGSRYIRVSSYFNQGQPSGTVIFNGTSPYEQYYKFVRFCAFEPLSFVYTPLKGSTFYRRVSLASIDKGEIDDEYGILECDVKFSAMTPWYRKKEMSFTPAPSTSGWIWTPTWPIAWGGSNVAAVEFDSDATDESSGKLTIYGPATNPAWSLYVDNVKTMTGAITITLTSDEYLVVDNTGEYPSMTVHSSSGSRDVYQLSDFSTERFLKLQYGKNRVVVSSEETEPLKFKMEADLYYESV